MKKVVLAGGTGFIGKYMENNFKAMGYEVLIISRQVPYISWDDYDGIVKALNSSEMVINLAGRSINCRYNAKNREDIMRSRMETTKILGRAILDCSIPPRLWVNSSTATIYRHALDRPMTEEHGEIGSGFSVEVAKEWEKVLFSFQLPNTRQVALRIAIVLGKDGGVMTPFTNLVRFGLGGVQGSGDQMFSWIHIEDLFKMIVYLRDHEELQGVFNGSSPYPVTNRELMQRLRHTMKIPFGLPSPKWLLEMGAIFINTETELILKSRWVIPERMERAGYAFTFKHIEEALQDIKDK